MTVQAKGKGHVEQPKAPEKPVVTGVDTAAKTVTLKTGDQVQVYALTAFTKITIDGNPATPDKIQTGMHADISVGAGGLTKIDLTDAGKGATDVSKKKKK